MRPATALFDCLVRLVMVLPVWVWCGYIVGERVKKGKARLIIGGLGRPRLSHGMRGCAQFLYDPHTATGA